MNIRPILRIPKPLPRLPRCLGSANRDHRWIEFPISLEWNEDAIRFYAGMGATVMPEWRICRVAGQALERLGADRSRD